MCPFLDTGLSYSVCLPLQFLCLFKQLLGSLVIHIYTFTYMCIYPCPSFLPHIPPSPLSPPSLQYAIDDSLPFILNILLAQLSGLFGTLVVTCYGLPWFTLLLVPLGLLYYHIQKYYRRTSRYNKYTIYRRTWVSIKFGESALSWY